MATPLCPAELLVLSGPDAVAFAQAQFTSDVNALATGSWQWSAWLDPQGRARACFALLRVEPERLLAWLPLGGATPMRDALVRFVFRSKVKLAVETEWTLHALDADDRIAPIARDAVVPHDTGFAFLQPGQPERAAWIARVDTPPLHAAALNRWRLDDIAARLPLLSPDAAGVFVAQALDLERIDAIRFDKGCYPGQEIVARLHFRGGNKRHLSRVRVEGAPPASMTAIIDSGDRVAGHILYAAASEAGDASEAIAVIGDDATTGELRTATGASLRASI